ncbi:MAG TPA: MlaD family protein [Bacteroidales bacterium]|nr:MlaD family protein [Bacteroidales bacterium]
MKAKRPYLVALSFISALLLFVWGFNFLKGKDVFKKDRVFYARYAEVNGLVKANPVVINGLRIGQVSDLYFDPAMNGNIIVEISIHTDFPVPSNSVARIFSSDLMGSKAIDLQLGNATNKLQSGDTLMSSIEASLMEEVNAQVAPLKNKAEGLLSSVDSVVVALQAILNENAKENIMSSLQNISNTFKNVESTTANIDSMVVEERNRIAAILYNVEMITQNLEHNTREIDRIINNVASFSDSLAVADVAGSIREAKIALAEINLLIASINQGQGTMGKLMQNDSLYLGLQHSSEALNNLLEDIKANPKRYVKFSLF